MKEKNKNEKNIWIQMLKVAAYLVLGVLFLTWPDMVVSLLPVILGCLLILEAVFKLFQLLSLCHKGYQNWWMPLIGCVILIVLGAILILRDLGELFVMIRVLGGGLILDGALELWIQIARRKCRKPGMQTTRTEKYQDNDTSPTGTQEEFYDEETSDDYPDEE